MNVPFRVVNVVSTAVLSRPVDIESLPRLFPNEAVHDEKIYGGRVAYFKSEAMQGKVTIFPSGKIISVGTRSTGEAIRELNLVAKALRAGLTAPKIRNIVATADLGHGVDLELINSIREIDAVYEPEQFSGSIIKISLGEDKIATMLLFASGKLICVGLKNKEEIKNAIEQLIKIIRLNNEQYGHQ